MELTKNDIQAFAIKGSFDLLKEINKIGFVIPSSVSDIFSNGTQKNKVVDMLIHRGYVSTEAKGRDIILVLTDKGRSVCKRMFS